MNWKKNRKTQWEKALVEVWCELSMRAEESETKTNPNKSTQKHFGTRLVDSLKCTLSMNQIKIYYDEVWVYYGNVRFWVHFKNVLGVSCTM